MTYQYWRRTHWAIRTSSTNQYNTTYRRCNKVQVYSCISARL